MGKKQYVFQEKKSVTNVFKAGRRYKISAQKHKSKEDTAVVLQYLGKIGIHHKFQHPEFGWILTYTDAQLIGKVVVEVDG